MQPNWFDSEKDLTGEGSEEMKKVLTDILKNKAPELYKEMEEIFEDYNDESYKEDDFRPAIFDSNPKSGEIGLFVYNPNEIDPINLCFLMVFGNGAIDSDDIFMDYREFFTYVREKDPELADFMEEGYPFISFFNLAQFICKVNLF